MNLCAIIPSHNHASAIGDIVAALAMPVYIIDDASNEPTRLTLAQLHNPGEKIVVHRLEVNQGKGGAVMAGFELAIAAGYTHALQIDADGQHDIRAIPQLRVAAEANPTALISGQPIYDDSIPTARKIGRWATHVWVWVETLSLRITDSMCGFRIYPLQPVAQLLAKEPLGRRMDFDTEIMVRLFWRGTDVVMVPVHVIYPPGNISNFDVLRDNWRITKMHTRLVFTMLRRLPTILAHRPRTAYTQSHWAGLRERGGYFGIAFCFWICRMLGRTGCAIILRPIVLYFYLTSTKHRDASREFLTRALGRTPSMAEGYRHFLNFALRTLDVMAAWSGRITPAVIDYTNPAMFAAMKTEPRGAVIVVSHLGNIELARALLHPATRDRMVVLTHTHHAENFNRMLRQHYPNAAMNLVQVTEIGPETMIDMQQRIEQGAWICIAGDRTAVLNDDHNSTVPFMGTPAPFAQGPWILASLLRCPVYLLFCLPKNNRYDLAVERFADRIALPRNDRAQALDRTIAAYAARLEHYATANPLQWFNFYNFWAA